MQGIALYDKHIPDTTSSVMNTVLLRGLGVALAAALVLHAVSRGWELLPEMLWACHVASAVMAAGLLMAWPRWVAVGLLLHAAVGMPSFLVDLLFDDGHPTLTSWLVHVLPLVAGMYGLRKTGLPPRTWLRTWSLLAGTFAVSILVTPVALNVNLVHAAWEPLSGVLPTPWPVRALNLGGALVCLFFAEHLLRRMWRLGDTVSTR